MNLVTVMDHPRTGVLAPTLRQNKHLRSEAQQQAPDDGARNAQNLFLPGRANRSESCQEARGD